MNNFSYLFRCFQSKNVSTCGKGLIKHFLVPLGKGYFCQKNSSSLSSIPYWRSHISHISAYFKLPSMNSFNFKSSRFSFFKQWVKISDNLHLLHLLHLLSRYPRGFRYPLRQQKVEVLNPNGASADILGGDSVMLRMYTVYLMSNSLQYGYLP